MKNIKSYTALRPHITFFAILIDWAIIIMAVYSGHYYGNIFLSLLAIIVIGSRQHSLSTLSHDFVHYSVFKNKVVSEYIGNISTSWPLFYRTSGFRSQHLMHHRHLNTINDPDLLRRYKLEDWTFPKKPKSLSFLLLRDLLGLNFHQNIKKLYILHNKNGVHKKNFKKESLALVLTQAFFYIGLLILIVVSNNILNFLIFWIIPFATYHKFIKRIRAISEHFAIPNNNYKEQTRTTIINPIESFLICPRNINYHLEHHLYPNVPWYNLKRLSRDEEEDIRGSNLGHYTKGIFTGLMREIINVDRADCISQKVLD